MQHMDSELDLSGASISETATDNAAPRADGATKRFQPPRAPAIQLPNQDAEYVSHIAVDIGGSLVKLVYFSSSDPSELGPEGCFGQEASGSGQGQDEGSAHHPHRGGKLHFVNFETSRVEDAIDFIEAKGLHRHCGKNGPREMRVKATGGGAYKYADMFKERLGVVLEKEDEISCVVSGCNFLLRAIHHEAFTYANGVATFIPTNEESDLYPYLLVNIGSGVSMVKVTGDNQFERVSGSSIGGGTFWGLCRLLTGVENFDDMLELSMQGDNASVDMLVGDIYGGRDYTSIGLSATTIASSFGKVVSQDKSLPEYAPADICLALCRMVAYNIGQLAHMVAVRHGIKRIFFGGFFIRGHPYTMETISYAIRFWSKGEMAAMFLRHEGFLGAVGAFLTVHPMVMPRVGGGAAEGQPGKVRARFVERFSMGAPLTGGAVVGPAIRDVSEKVSWVEKFVASSAGLGAVPAAAAAAPGDGAASASAAASAASAAGPSGSGVARPELAPVGEQRTASGGLLEQQVQPAEAFTQAVEAAGDGGRVNGNPMLRAATMAAHGPYGGAGVPRTMSLADPGVLPSPGSVGSAMLLGKQRLGRQLSLHVGVLHFSPTLEPFPLLADPAAYEPNTLNINAEEEELRWWLDILRQQIPVVMEKAAASEGNGEAARRRAAAFGRAFGAHLDSMQAEPGSYGALGLGELFEMREECLREFSFSDVYRLEKQRENAAALAVLPDLLREVDEQPLPGRLLALVEGVLAANIFDWGSQACVALYQAGAILDIYRDARLKLHKRPWCRDTFDEFAARIMEAVESEPPRAPYRRAMLFVDNAGADIVLGMIPFARELLRLGCEVVMVANSLPAINDITAAELKVLLGSAAEVCPIIKAAREAALRVEKATGGHVPPYPGLRPVRRSSANLQLLHPTASHPLPGSSPSAASPSAAAPSAASPSASHAAGADPQPGPPGQQGLLAPAWHAAASNPAVNPVCPKLYVVANGQGSPCLDLRRVPDRLAEACAGVDLVVIEGMGRAIHTNLNAQFSCDVLKLAMIKTERLAKKLFGGNLYDCMCIYEGAEHGTSALGG